MIENRLGNKENLYTVKLGDIEKIDFIQQLARIIRFHEEAYMRKLQLRKFWQSIPAIITYMKEHLSHHGLIDTLAIKLRTHNTEACEKFEQKKAIDKEKEKIIMFFTNTC